MTWAHHGFHARDQRAGGRSQAARTPPTISAIADQTTLQDTPTPAIPFTIGDAETDASNLTVYATSANPALVPTNNIVFGGSDTNRTITLTPVSGATGNVAITVFVTDGSLTTNVTFQLAVTDTLIPSRLGFNTLPPNLTAQSVTNSQHLQRPVLPG